MDKRAVAEVFGRAAEHYDGAAHLQRRVADQLLAQVSELPLRQAGHVVDLGTGTGYCLPTLNQRFQPTLLTALDLAEPMLALARERVERLNLVQADLENPPLADNSVDLAVSSLAVQWLDRPEAFIARLAKVLKPGGYLALSTLGPETLRELRQAWTQVDQEVHVNRFMPASDWQAALAASPLTLTLWQAEQLEVRYDAPLALVRELKALGAHHVERQRTPMVGHLRPMLRAYEEFVCADGRYPATWDVFYLIARKPL
ncbi:malonyl-ACP O-methyltransferase BioC [Reinekea sp.]|jgi:malonyl-CoA O-methyltransferase|uniref:malonyl-ACP O-methyltransferase BioC n=1 Tax=Reinekea sp. TaxID=1970455 RepID=UPI002A811CB0|nr:malonyl-ACP O-methyltransferase BioC [Reinekea sp.]